MGDAVNNRVTTAQFYEKLLQNNERMDQMERRILDKLSQLPDLSNQVNNNTKEIDALRTKELNAIMKRSNIIDGINALLALLAAATAAAIGKAP